MSQPILTCLSIDCPERTGGKCNADKRMPDTITKRIEKILSERESKMFKYYESVFKEDFEGGYPQEYDSPLKSFIQTLRTETVDEVLAEVEKRLTKAKDEYREFGLQSIEGKIDALSALKQSLLKLKE